MTMSKESIKNTKPGH